MSMGHLDQISLAREKNVNDCCTRRCPDAAWTQNQNNLVTWHLIICLRMEFALQLARRVIALDVNVWSSACSLRWRWKTVGSRAWLVKAMQPFRVRMIISLSQHDSFHCHVFNLGGLECKHWHWSAWPSTWSTWTLSNIWTAMRAAVVLTCFCDLFPMIAFIVTLFMLHMARH